MPVLSFVRRSSRNDDAFGANPARLVNLFPEPAGEGGRTTSLLWPCYGMQEKDALDGVFVRAMYEYETDVYAILPGSFYRVSALGAVKLGAVPLGDTAAISRNLDAVTACIGGSYYVWDTAASSLSSPATGPVSGVAWVEYLAGRTIIGEEGTGKFAWSDIADPATFPGLNFATAEAREDETVRGIVVGNYLYLMGKTTTEVWAPVGSGANAFGPTGAVLDRGLRSFGLACVADGAIFAVGEDNIAYLFAGNEFRAISTPAVNASIAGGQPETCVFWAERGHKFCAITFSDRPTWVCDLATGEWWERAEGPNKGAWRGRHAARLGQDWLVGGSDGTVYRLQESATDAGSPLYREATSYVLGNGDDWITVAELEIGTSAGVETATIQLEVGEDGVTFGLPIMRELPPVGNFSGKTIFRALGRRKRHVVRLSMTGAPLAIYGDCRVRTA